MIDQGRTVDRQTRTRPVRVRVRVGHYVNYTYVNYGGVGAGAPYTGYAYKALPIAPVFVAIWERL